MRMLRAELAKLASLPAAWVAVVVGLAVPAGVAVLARGAGPDSGFQELAFGVTGAIILGVTAVSSEYTADDAESGGGRQITTSLTAVPSRNRFLLAKAAAVVIVTATLAAVATALTLGLAQGVFGDAATPLTAQDATRVLGVVLYWVLTALLGFGITLLTRSGVVPLVIMIVNTSVVSVSYLLSRVTTLAGYLPDLAGARMFIRDLDGTVDLAPVVGGLVMTAWVVALLAAGAVAAHRRDA